MNHTLGAILISAGGIVVAAAILWAASKTRRLFLGLHSFLEGWNGAAERRDKSGAKIADAEPGVLAQIRCIRTDQQTQATRQQSFQTEVTVLRSDVALLTRQMGEVRGLVGLAADQLQPNDGHSVYDKVTRTAKAVVPGEPDE